MASLVQFLASGVNGAQSGTATFLLRGSASSAAGVLYNEFEELTQPASNVVSLDANGSAEVYCDAYVDVELRTSAGVLLRTVTLGHAATAVEVESTSFTGTDYDGNPANTVGEPITLKALLDKWILSAGAPDWQVDVDGNPVNISTALSSFTGMFINPKDPQYGAVGDGVTNDTVAITNAFAAADEAGGGTVIFPPGTYVCNAVTISATNIAILGFGQAVIRFGTGGWTFSDDTITSVKSVEGLQFETTGSPARLLSFAAGGQNLSVKNCTFDSEGVTSEVLLFDGDDGLYRIDGCRFLLAPGLSQAALNHAGGVNKTVYVSNCAFEMEEDWVATVIRGSCFNVSDCLFDGSLVVAASFTAIDPEDPDTAGFMYGVVRGCEFSTGGATVNAFSLGGIGPGSRFSEHDNVFFSIDDPYAISTLGTLDTTSVIKLGSREGRQLTFNNTTFPSLTPAAPLPYDKFVVNHTNASNLTLGFAGTNRPVGLEWDAIVLNNSGGSRDITFTGTGQSVTISSVPDGGRATAHYFTYLEVTGTVAVGITGTLIGAT